MKNLTLIFNDVEEVHLGKDVFLTPYYIAKEFNLNLNIVFPNTATNQNIPLIYRSATFKRLNLLNSRYRFIENFNFFKYLLLNSKKIDHLMLFHLTNTTMRQALLYKRFNPAGKAYVKLDMNLDTLKHINTYNLNSFRRRKTQKLMYQFMSKVDLISCETLEIYNEIRSNGISGIDIKDKLAYIPNGIDDELLDKLALYPMPFALKEKIMISVGRIGTEQKNNELLLEALESIDLIDWKIYFIGPITHSFKLKYKDFILKNPNKKNKVLLIGNIPDKKILFEFYNKAKIFIFTSNSEGFPLVFPEALYFGDYIITTDVGGAKDITKNGTIGAIIPIKDSNALKMELLKVIHNQINLEQKYNESIQLSQKKFLWSQIIKNSSLIKKVFNSL